MEASNHLDHSIGSRLREATSHLLSAPLELQLVALEAAQQGPGWSTGPGRRQGRAVVQPGKRRLRGELTAALSNTPPSTRHPAVLTGQELYQGRVVLAALLLGKRVER